MARMLWLNWSGGGNLPPSLGIARALTGRGHRVAFVGRPEMVPRVEAAGFRAIEIADAYAQLDRYPAGHHLTRPACFLTSPATAAELRAVLAAEAPDLLLIDGMFPAALAEAQRLRCPRAVFCHTFLFRMLDRWRNTIATLNGMRREAGFEPLPELDELWQSCDRVIVTSLGALDAAPPPGWERVRHVGPVLADEPCAIPVALPWSAEDLAPLVLVSFSTGFEQRSVEKLQRSLDALASLPVHVVATTGGIVEPEELTPPGNAIVLRHAAHDPLLERAALVVTHGGHGTAMRALRHGVPMVVIPGPAHDQALIGGMVEEWGVGRALRGDADATAIRAAAERVLANPACRANAARLAALFAGSDGARRAADEIEALLGARNRSAAEGRPAA